MSKTSMTLEEFNIRMAEEGKKKNLKNFLDKKFPKGIAGYAALHAVTHPWLIVEKGWLEAKWAWQRVVRGWDERAAWSFDHYLATLIPQIMKELRDYKAGVPMAFLYDLPTDENYNYSDESLSIAKERWEKVLNKIILGFEKYNEVIECSFSDFTEEESAVFEEGFALLKEHFGSFWD